MSIQIKLIAALLSIIALAGMILGYGHHQYTQGVQHTADHYEVAIKAKNAEAATQLAAETAKTRAAEQALQDRKNTQEMTDANHQKTVADLSDRLRRAAGQSGRLRDPNAIAGCRPSGGGATGQAASTPGDRPADDAETGGLFSAGATELFQRLTREADDINDAYASCRADTYTVRTVQ